MYSGGVVMKNQAIAIAGGCAVGLMGTFIFNFLINMFPLYKPETASALGSLLGMEEYNVIHYSLIVYLCLFAPITEEYIFRGLFWEFIEGVFNKKLAYLLTTILFCLAHIELLHIVSILPLSIYFGWLRLNSKSIYLPTLAHIGNNTLATVIFIL
tara:strand:- start:1113 stop:1577 length:465 start_codon:yes stop_codon:yes gene_type:complete